MHVFRFRGRPASTDLSVAEVHHFLLKENTYFVCSGVFPEMDGLCGLIRAMLNQTRLNTIPRSFKSARRKKRGIAKKNVGFHSG